MVFCGLFWLFVALGWLCLALCGFLWLVVVFVGFLWLVSAFCVVAFCGFCMAFLCCGFLWLLYGFLCCGCFWLFMTFCGCLWLFVAFSSRRAKTQSSRSEDSKGLGSLNGKSFFSGVDLVE